MFLLFIAIAFFSLFQYSNTVALLRIDSMSSTRQHLVPGLAIAALCISCTVFPPNGALFDSQEKNSIPVDTSGLLVDPLIFQNPLYEAASSETLTHLELNLLHTGRTGAITISRNPGMAPVEKNISGKLNASGDQLIIDAQNGSRIETGALFVTITSNKARVQSKPSPFIIKKLTGKDPHNSTSWQDVLDQIAGGDQLVYLFNRVWNKDLIIDSSFNGKTFANGTLQSITIQDAANVTLTSVHTYKMEIAGTQTSNCHLNYCDISYLGILPDVHSVTGTNSSILGLVQESSGNIVFRNTVISIPHIAPGATNPFVNP
jgi:hypothetical protein